MNHRVLTIEQINDAKFLRAEKGYTKRKLAKYFNSLGIEVSEGTIWENVFTTVPTWRRVDRREYLRQYFKTHKRKKLVCVPCGNCEICMTKEFDDHQIPVNYQMGDRCIECYMRGLGLSYMSLL